MRIITIILLLTLPAATVGGKDHKFAARCPPSSLTMQEMFDMQHTYEALWQVHLEKRLETEGAYTESAARRFGELCPGNGAVAATAADAPADSRHDDVAAATTSAAPAAVAAPAPAAPAAPAAARSVTEAPPLPPPPSLDPPPPPPSKYKLALCLSGQLRGAETRLEDLAELRKAMSATPLGEARIFASIHIKDARHVSRSSGGALQNASAAAALHESLEEHTRVNAVIRALDPASYEVGDRQPRTTNRLTSTCKCTHGLLVAARPTTAAHSGAHPARRRPQKARRRPPRRDMSRTGARLWRSTRA